MVDRPLEDLSKHKLVAIVNWSTASCDVVEVDQHSFTAWEVAPGTPTRVSKLEFAAAVPTLVQGNQVTVYVLDRRVVARHYILPETQPTRSRSGAALPSPIVGARAGRSRDRGEAGVDWQVFACVESASQEITDGGAPSGLVVDLSGGAPSELSVQAAASGNLLRVRHGKTAAKVLGSGDATQSGQRFTTPDAPIASDLDETGNPVPSMVVRVEGVRWDEVPSLFGVGTAEVFAVRRGPDGAETLEFGDGVQGSRGCRLGAATWRPPTASAAAARARSSRARSRACSAACAG